MAAVPALERTTFRTSRLLEFCSRKELVAQTGHEPDAWPLVVCKELVDNALDACEEASVAPEIVVQVKPRAITVVDNGPGMPPESVTDILDFSSRVSSREAYVAPDRGAQGNALKTILGRCRSFSMAKPAASRSAPAVFATRSSSRSTRSGRRR